MVARSVVWAALLIAVVLAEPSDKKGSTSGDGATVKAKTNSVAVKTVATPAVLQQNSLDQSLAQLKQASAWAAPQQYASSPYLYNNAGYLAALTRQSMMFGGANPYASFLGFSPNMMVGNLQGNVINDIMHNPMMGQLYLRSPRVTQFNERIVPLPWPLAGNVG